MVMLEDKQTEQMRCTLRRCFLSILLVLFVIFVGFLAFFIYLIMSGEDTAQGKNSKNFCIKTQWDGQGINHNPVCFELSANSSTHLELKVSAPFFDDPKSPNVDPGSFPQLWDYEVAEAFFLNSKTQKYLEVELNPKGLYLVLLLDGYRHSINEHLPLDFKAQIEGDSWTGKALIPAEYFPPKVDSFNAYAIHGSGENRVYESLFPVPQGQYSDPDFHRLSYFGPLAFHNLMPSNQRDDYISSLWT